MITAPSELLKKVNTPEELKREMIPYQAELLAAQLDVRLYPFLPYQYPSASKEVVEQILKEDPRRIDIAMEFIKANKGRGFEFPRNIIELSNQLLLLMQELYETEDELGKTLDIKVRRRKYLTLMLGNVYLFPKVKFKTNYSNPFKNRNCDVFVTAPFYPKEFGRYSEDIITVINRKADVGRLSKIQINVIRFLNRLVSRQHGVIFKDPKKWPGNGVWVPERRRRQTTFTSS